MSEFARENYLREESFGPVTSGFYDLSVEAEFEEVQIVAWPEKLVDPTRNEVGLSTDLADVLADSKEIIRDTSRCLEVIFSDVYAMNIRDEGWEEWQWDHTKVPKLGTGRLSIRNFPVLKVENSAWKDRIFPEWNRDWMGTTTHWRLISTTNSVEILARSAKGEWRKGI